ncbi:MAG: DNA translocase FtsK [Patescibacteria group bacterium]|nr:DNA translocase FtsK [Patescibacteria group bacterium]
MARRKKRRYYYNSASRRGSAEAFEPIGLNLSPDTKRGIAIVLFLVAAIISALGIFHTGGYFGELVDKVLRLLFGQTAIVTPAIFLAVAGSLFLGGRSKTSAASSDEAIVPEISMTRTYFGAALFVFAITGALHVFAISKSLESPFELVSLGRGGGYFGVLTGFPLYSLMGFGAALVVLSALAIIAILVAFDLSLHRIFKAFISLLSFKPNPMEAKSSAEKGASPPASAPVKINTMETLGFAVNAVRKTPIPPREERTAEETEEPAGERPVLATAPDRFRKGQWKLPPTDLLEDPSTPVHSGNIEANVKIIKKTLEDFGVTVEMGEVNVGPTVTQYTFRPAVGVRLAQIVSRQADLALALAAPSIRIEAPIPGKSLVGIEVPNATKALVGLRGLLETPAFVNTPSNLLFVLGRDVAGHPMMADLAKMPHLLIAGATGAGKSVCINTIMTSFLYRNSPEELRFIVIDPKRVELTLYNGIPHLLTPVVTDHKQAVNALKWMVSEMDQRYRMLSEAGRRNIEEYNAGTEEKLPYLVLVVDELADLMSVAKADVETAIVRLAQMARAVGLHLVLATQRPSVNIITGLIKANITSRVAFSVASQVDSRTILDMAGAEDLLGHGDMLYMTASLPKPKRIQAPYMSEKEVRRVVDFLKGQSGPVEYQTDILEKTQRALGVGGGSLDDDGDVDSDMINAAIEEISRSRKASASFLQRRLKVGYARAARILDVLEERGLIGPADGAKPREIFMDDSPPPIE